jgi:tripartite-type tricarboxylate transporter receptor subunit TctC
MPRELTLNCLLCIAALGWCAMPASAHAESYPSRSITVVVPFPAGGPSDVVARIVSDHMSRTLGHLLVIENVAGAGGHRTVIRGLTANPEPDLG